MNWSWKESKEGGGENAQLIFVKPFAKLFCYASEITDRDLAGVIVVEELEGTSDLIPGVAGEEVGGHFEGKGRKQSTGDKCL
jgi:hypothetical protein